MAKTHKTKEGHTSSHKGVAKGHDGDKHKGAHASHASKSKTAHEKASPGKHGEEETGEE